MDIIKVGNTIQLTLNEEERNAVDYFIKKNGIGILDEYFGHFIQTRIDTAKLEQKTEVMDVFYKMTKEEQDEFLSRGLMS